MGRMKSTAVWTAVVMAGLAGGWQVAQGQAPASSQTPAPWRQLTPQRFARSTNNGGRISRRGENGRPWDRTARAPRR